MSATSDDGRYMRNGYTISVYLPPDAPWVRVQWLLDRISRDSEDVFDDRLGWDPSVAGHFGDVLHADSCNHVYLSTGCVHENDPYPNGQTGHEYCESETGVCGQKTPGVCKGCGAPCICPNHQKKEGDIVDG